MELVGFAQEVLRSGAEYVASYRAGQSALRMLDRGLWVLEKCARWAVPPPLDADSPQPELVRPLPWVFFLMVLVALRVTRETISLINLVFGIPPLRPADVVTYIQGKRRYIRTLKYQGSRTMRARSSAAATREPWYRSIQSLFEFTMCFRRSHNYGNNNTTQLSHNDEVLVVKRSKRREPTAAGASTSEDPMERFIEKIMVDLDADSDDDSSFTLTNAASVRSESISDCEDGTVATLDNNLTTTKYNEDTRENILENNIAEGGIESSNYEDSSHIQNQTQSEGIITSSTPKKNENDASRTNNVVISKNEDDATRPQQNHKNTEAKEIEYSTTKNKSDLSEPIEPESPHTKTTKKNENNASRTNNVATPKNEDDASRTNDVVAHPSQENHSNTEAKEIEDNTANNKSDLSESIEPESPHTKDELTEDSAFGESQSPKALSPKEASKNFLQGEKCGPQKTSKNTKIANGRIHSAHNKKKGTTRRDPENKEYQFM